MLSYPEMDYFDMGSLLSSPESPLQPSSHTNSSSLYTLSPLALPPTPPSYPHLLFPLDDDRQRHDVSPDSGNEDPNEVEERVQVDRRKLEKMISDEPKCLEDNLPTAEDFFSHIMTTTGAHISWPSRLKIGAKTKKDPFVKISGLLPQVQIAKERVLHILRTKQNRCTLKMDVPFTDHSHIIGRQGKNTQRVMKDTGCHIHFPDSNKNQDCDKSNQVSIAGPPDKVEIARHMIRDLAPLTVTFELKQMKPGVNPQSLVDHPALESLTQTEDLHVLVRHNRSSGTPFALVRGSAFQEIKIREAVYALQNYLFVPGTLVVCSLSLEILQPQQEAVKGPNNNNIRVISQRTGAQIHYPNVERSGATTFYIQGALDSILMARKYIIGCLPVFLMFELRPDQGLTINTDVLGNERNLNITVKPKRGCDNKSVVIRSLESNLTNVYEVRQKLMGSSCHGESVTVCEDYAFMAELCSPQVAASNFYSGFNGITPGFNSLSVNTAQQHIPLPPSAPMLISPVSPLTSFAAVMHLAPEQAYGQVMANGSSNGGYVSSSTEGTSSNGTHRLTSSSEGSSTVKQTEQDHDHDDEEETQIIIRNHHVTFPRDLLHTQIHSSLVSSPEKPVHPDLQRTLNSDLSDIAPSTPNDPLPGRSPIASAVFQSAQKLHRKNSISSVDWKAPGAERNGSCSTPDYNTQHLLATRLMAEHPQGPRRPTDAWAGLGFSRTMNDQILREMLPSAQNKQEEKETDVKRTEGKGEGKLPSVMEEEMSLGTLGPWPVGANASPVYNRKAFLSTMHFEQNVFNGGVFNSWSGLKDYVEKEDLSGLLSQIGFGQYIDLFQSEEIDFETFLSLNEADLRQIGVNTVGARKKIKSLIDSLKALQMSSEHA